MTYVRRRRYRSTWTPRRDAPEWAASIAVGVLALATIVVAAIGFGLIV